MRSAVNRVIVAICVALASTGVARSNPSMLGTFKLEHPTFIHPHNFATEHVVIQVSEAQPGRWTLALNNAQNILDAVGAQKAQIVVVAYGPGLRMLLSNTPDAERIQSLNAEGVEFDACHNTMEAMARKIGHMPILVPQAVIVPAGVLRIMQLETHGFTYLKP